MAGAVFHDRYQAFIGVLAEARKASGVTQQQLAARLSKPQSYVSKVERCERRLDVIEFCFYAEALNIAPGELMEKLLQGI